MEPTTRPVISDDATPVRLAELDATVAGFVAATLHERGAAHGVRHRPPRQQGMTVDPG